MPGPMNTNPKTRKSTSMIALLAVSLPGQKARVRYSTSRGPQHAFQVFAGCLRRGPSRSASCGAAFRRSAPDAAGCRWTFTAGNGPRRLTVWLARSQ